ncbi:BadF/BadG/BcrA/BcrD ATPase family protein [Alkalimonas delamerensis]|uniref:BadF/BadG/BcrA/BcrD ATPase family protein n=1 Tax=Alkalimonas delamerensis TaxID=265981 RepID=A0ABT9GKM6_9GAMM|nr:BadF/BadG/BcrA/BcrD ATPase family protein [Alkalimonas delamerensis]MDP4527527.1 BadF/BadG/BcrA/BcrD ATPase family protein [Alkalimonas delamerensis]
MITSAESQPLYLGIDGGGTKCRAILVDQQMTVLGEGIAGPGNPLRGMEIATASIMDATRQALLCAGLPERSMADLTVGAGLAGVNVPQYHALFRDWEHPFAAFHLTSDLHIACMGAHHGQDGAVIIIGTGSCGLAQSGQQMLEIGGHGFPYGDSGSGAWFGLQLVHHVLLSLDGLSVPTSLSQALLKASHCHDQLALVQHFMHASPTLYAQYAPLVFDCAEQGDACAQRIVQQGAAHINGIAHRLLSIQPPKLALIGGLAYKLEPYLDAAVRKCLVTADASPEWGAIWYAQKLAQQQEKTA